MSEIEHRVSVKAMTEKLSLQDLQDAIKRLQAMPAKYVIMSTDKDGNPIITELPSTDTPTAIDTPTEYV